MYNISRLDSLGSEKIEFEEVSDVIETTIGEFIDRVHQNIRTENAIVTGKIADIQIERTDQSITVTANPWLSYVDKGVNGSKAKLYDTPYSYKDKRPPVEPFKQWIAAKNIQLRDNAKYKGKESPVKHLTEEDQINNAAYAMREKVFQEGQAPGNVYTKEIPKLVEELEKEIADFCAEKFLNNITIQNK